MIKSNIMGKVNNVVNSSRLCRHSSIHSAQISYFCYPLNSSAQISLNGCAFILPKQSLWRSPSCLIMLESEKKWPQPMLNLFQYHRCQLSYNWINNSFGTNQVTANALASQRDKGSLILGKLILMIKSVLHFFIFLKRHQ